MIIHSVYIRPRQSILLNVVLLMIAMLSVPLYAGGSFGINKVQYQSFAWKQIQSEHFDIYFYEGGDSLAFFTAAHIEEMHDSLVSKLGFQLHQRIPILLHNNHTQFEQTNVSPFPLPEAVGGFTEFFKNRIVLPFDGSYAHFHHVLHHELLHAMLFDFFAGSWGGKRKMEQLPLWWHEGLAEWTSLEGWNEESETFLLDAVIYGHLEQSGLQGYLAYRGGQHLMYYLEEAFGKGTIKKILQKVKRNISFSEAFHQVCKISLEDFAQAWIRALRRSYWPEIAQREPLENIARPLTRHSRNNAHYHINPVLSPDGNYIAWFDDKGNWEQLVVYNIENKKDWKRLQVSGRTAHNESFHSFSDRPAWSPDAQYLALVVKRNGRDVIDIIDVENEEVIHTLELPFESIFWPAWSPDGKQMAFTALHHGQADLYILPLKQDGKNNEWIDYQTKNKLVDYQQMRITHDYAREEKAQFSPDGKRLLFVRDQKPEATHYKGLGKKEIVIYELVKSKSKQRERIYTTEYGSLYDAVWAGDSALIYISTASGFPNIYHHTLFTDSLYALSNTLEDISSLSWNSHHQRLSFQALQAGGWDIFLMDSAFQHQKAPDIPLSTWRAWEKHQKAFPKESTKDTAASFFIPRHWNYMPSWRDSLQSDTQKKQHQRDSLLALQNRESFPYMQPLDSNAYLDSNANHIIKDYESRWSIDQVAAAAGISTLDGVGGQGAIALSDLMGDQALQFWFYGSGVSWDDINAFVQYAWKPLRPDFFVQFVHSTRSSWRFVSEEEYSDSIARNTQQEIHIERYEDGQSSTLNSYDSVMQSYRPLDDLPLFYEDRYLALSAGVQYPFSIFSRMDWGIEAGWIFREYLPYEAWYSGLQDTFFVEYPAWKSEYLPTLKSALGWSFDNARWGPTGPLQGSRRSLRSEVLIPGALQDQWAFGRIDLDWREYIRIAERFSIALRAGAGLSQSLGDFQNPHAYLVGGDPLTFNYHRNMNNYQNTLQEAYVSTWEMPLRGFRYHDFRGTRMALLNAELRFPFIDQIRIAFPLPLQISHVRGVLFSDYGGAWDGYPDYKKDLGWSWGMGWRLNLGIFVLRYTKAWNHLNPAGRTETSRTYWSLGAEF